MKKIVAIALAAVMAFGMVSVGLAEEGGGDSDQKSTTVSTGNLGEVYEWTLPESTTLTAGTGIAVSGSVTATVSARLNSTNCIKLTAVDSITMKNADESLSFTCNVSNGVKTDDELTANGSAGLTVCEGGGVEDEGIFYLFGDCSTTGTYTGSLTITAAIAATPSN